MSTITSDPTLAKAAILLLGGMVVVLLIAVIILAVKKYEIYYIDDPELNRDPKQDKKAKSSKPKKSPLKKPDLKKYFTPVDSDEEEDEEKEPAAAAAAATAAAPAAQAAVKEPNFIKADAPQPVEQTDTGFVPEMNNIPPVKNVTPEEHTPGQKLKGIRITISVGSQHTTVEVTSFPCLVGREADACDVIISEPAVSRKHARFIKSGEDVLVEDVSEHNGTFLNEMKIPPLGKARIHAGDIITLGRAHIRIDACLYE